MRDFLQAIEDGASGEQIAALPLPESYRAAVVRKDEIEMFEGLDSNEKDPRKSIHIEEVATPELAPDEAYVAVMASAFVPSGMRPLNVSVAASNFSQDGSGAPLERVAA